MFRYQKHLASRPQLSECEFVALRFVPSKLSLSDILSYYDRLRSYARHEDGLINSRLTWSLSVHGFLLGGYGLLANKVADTLADFNKTGSNPKVLEHVIAGLLVFQFVIAVIGVVVGFLSRRAIDAAHNAIQHVLAIAHDGFLKLNNQANNPEIVIKSDQATGAGEDSVRWLLPKITQGGDKGSHTVGALEYYRGLPLWLTVIWFVLGSISAMLCILAWFYPDWAFSHLGVNLTAPCSPVQGF
jgi:hypothetical protein